VLNIISLWFPFWIVYVLVFFITFLVIPFERLVGRFLCWIMFGLVDFSVEREHSIVRLNRFICLWGLFQRRLGRGLCWWCRWVGGRLVLHDRWSSNWLELWGELIFRIDYYFNGCELSFQWFSFLLLNFNVIMNYHYNCIHYVPNDLLLKSFLF
jgi:hypothetical protein